MGEAGSAPMCPWLPCTCLRITSILNWLLWTSQAVKSSGASDTKIYRNLTRVSLNVKPWISNQLAPSRQEKKDNRCYFFACIINAAGVARQQAERLSNIPGCLQWKKSSPGSHSSEVTVTAVQALEAAFSLFQSLYKKKISWIWLGLNHRHFPSRLFK